MLSPLSLSSQKLTNQNYFVTNISVTTVCSLQIRLYTGFGIPEIFIELMCTSNIAELYYKVKIMKT